MSKKRNKKASKPNNYKRPKCFNKILTILTAISLLVGIAKNLYDMFIK